jgi:hypothetical protein
MEKSFTDDKAFRVLLVIGLFGILFWSTYGHIMALYEDNITATYGATAFSDGIRFGHLHGLSNSIAATAAAIALPLIKSIRQRLKMALATVFGLALVFWNLGYTYAAFTTTAPTDTAFATALSTATNWILIPISTFASIAGAILFVALLYDLKKK